MSERGRAESTKKGNQHERGLTTKRVSIDLEREKETRKMYLHGREEGEWEGVGGGEGGGEGEGRRVTSSELPHSGISVISTTNNERICQSDCCDSRSMTNKSMKVSSRFFIPNLRFIERQQRSVKRNEGKKNEKKTNLQSPIMTTTNDPQLIDINIPNSFNMTK